MRRQASCKSALRQDVLVDPPAPFAGEVMGHALVLRLSFLQLHPSLAVVMPVMGTHTAVAQRVPALWDALLLGASVEAKGSETDEISPAVWILRLFLNTMVWLQPAAQESLPQGKEPQACPVCYVCPGFPSPSPHLLAAPALVCAVRVHGAGHRAEIAAGQHRKAAFLHRGPAGGGTPAAALRVGSSPERC